MWITLLQVVQYFDRQKWPNSYRYTGGQLNNKSQNRKLVKVNK
jgi:hypothetical protein